ncbi:serpentine type 7TM GPCR chemoreceptor srt domain-containing protein [Ditylenchus destructor]|uniref:Serpentine type 7TM GPCR chemoreceptor srt domain-containing protein n=1 Tax=Ditylenchus destructor TaxID=166010 RepID=A0AAD4R4C2_9BILA|nr:serpentine type 7TM GPCR chemoreceptor srt domain-containing protein [Ditylenchus destructor]
MELHLETTEILWIRPGAPPGERFFIGFLYVVFAVIFFVLQISVLTIFVVYKEYRNNMCYRVMSVISVLDCIQLIIHIYGGFITIYDTNYSTWAEKAILGGISNALCETLLPLDLALAFNRLLVFKTRPLARGIEVAIFYSLIYFSCLFGFVFLCLYMTPYVGRSFSSEAWSRNKSREWTQHIAEIDDWCSLPLVGITLVVYLTLLVVLVIKKRESTHVFDKSKTAYRFLAPAELKLLLQSLIHFSLATSLVVVWRIQDGVLPDNHYTVMTINLFWILYNGINPLLYLCINSIVRRRVFYLWCRRKIIYLEPTISLTKEPNKNVLTINHIAPKTPKSKLMITRSADPLPGRPNSSAPVLRDNVNPFTHRA